MLLKWRTASLYIKNPSFTITLVWDWNLPLENLRDAKFCCHIPQPIAVHTGREHKPELHILYVDSFATDWYRFYSAQSGAQKMPCVHMHPGFASGDWTLCTQWAVPAECDTVAAWNVVYQDFISHSIRTLAWFLPEAARFSKTSLENLPEVHASLIIPKKVVACSLPIFFIILRIRDACRSTE